MLRTQVQSQSGEEAFSSEPRAEIAMQQNHPHLIECLVDPPHERLTVLRQLFPRARSTGGARCGRVQLRFNDSRCHHRGGSRPCDKCVFDPRNVASPPDPGPEVCTPGLPPRPYRVVVIFGARRAREPDPRAIQVRVPLVRILHLVRVVSRKEPLLVVDDGQRGLETRLPVDCKAVQNLAG